MQTVADEELWAANGVRAASGANFEPFDCDGRQGAVDFLLFFDDGRTGALEVTSHAEAGSRQVAALLAKDRFVWPNPGNWPWRIAFDPQANVRRVRKIYEYVIITCEAHGASRPEELPDDLVMNDDVLFRAAYEEFHVRFTGHPNPDRTSEPVSVLPGAIAGGVDEHLKHLAREVTKLLTVPRIADHISKVARHKADEHHLFVIIGPGGLPFPQYYPLCGTPSGLPTDDPGVPDGLDHLWLATGWGPVLVSWGRGRGWHVHEVFDTPPPLISRRST